MVADVKWGKMNRVTMKWLLKLLRGAIQRDGMKKWKKGVTHYHQTSGQVYTFFFYKDQQIFFEAGMSLTFCDFQAETSLKCP